jgi:O-antigen/teichoic acid export membrane protein
MILPGKAATAEVEAEPRTAPFAAAPDAGTGGASVLDLARRVALAGPPAFLDPAGSNPGDSNQAGLSSNAPESAFAAKPISRTLRFVYGLADQCLSVGGMFVVNVALARIRSKEEYGIFALSYSLLTFLTGLHNAAILEAYTIYGSGRYHQCFAAYRRLLWRSHLWLLGALSGFLLAVWQGLRWRHSALASPTLLGMALTCGVLLSVSFVRRTFYMRRRPDLAARFSAGFFVSCMGLLALAVHSQRLNGLSAFLIVALAWSVAGLFIVRDHPPREPSMPVDAKRKDAKSKGLAQAPEFLRGEPGYWRDHWNYSRWVLVTALVFQFTAQAYFWAVAALLTVPDVAELRALYNLALPVDQILVAITFLIMPQMALHYAAREFGQLRHLWRQCALLYLTISLAFAFLVGVGSLPLLHAVYGGKFDNAAPLLRWYALLPVVMAVGNATNAAMKSMEKPQAVFYAYLASGAATLLLGIPLLVRFGLAGAIYGMLLSGASYTAVLTMSFYRCNRTLYPIPKRSTGANA